MEGKLLLILVFIFNVQFLFAQGDKDSTLTLPNGKTITLPYALSDIILDVKLDAVKEGQIEMNAFVDSINNYRGGEALPDFLFDECFDWQEGKFWEGIDAPISVRWKVLSGVNNKKVLKTILATHDKRLKKKCPNAGVTVFPYYVIPMIDKSFY